MREGLQKIVSSEDTIVALSTPSGRSGIGVIRVSGPAAPRISNELFKASGPLLGRVATLGSWRSPNGEVLDEVLVTFFPRPHSYTGEDTLEISAHGNPLVLKRIIATIQAAGARPASPGEFTLRAVANGKMDLVQAEALRDFIQAQTDNQARIALRQLDGAVSKRIAPIKNRLITVIAHLEAGIDFAEDDVELPDTTHVADTLRELRESLDELRNTYAYGRLVNEGVQIVIAGRPNVGKSSLFNRLVSMDRAIVTEIAGTTRDVLSEKTDLSGIPVQFFDTAGVRETSDTVERIGVTRTLETLTEADLVLLVMDGSALLHEEDRRLHRRIVDIPHLVVANKADLASLKDSEVEALKPVRVSALTGQGMGTLCESIVSLLAGERAQDFGDTLLTTARQNQAVSHSVESLTAAEAGLRNGTPHEMVLLDLYGALSSLNELTGEITTEDILGTIFSTFCIGK